MTVEKFFNKDFEDQAQVSEEEEKRKLIQTIRTQFRGSNEPVPPAQYFQKKSLHELRFIHKRMEITPDVIQKFLAKQEPQATEIIANHLKEQYTFKTIMDDKLPETWWYYEGVYKE